VDVRRGRWIRPAVYCSPGLVSKLVAKRPTATGKPQVIEYWVSFPQVGHKRYCSSELFLENYEDDYGAEGRGKRLFLP
jgi:hypothetical protein